MRRVGVLATHVCRSDPRHGLTARRSAMSSDGVGLGDIAQQESAQQAGGAEPSTERTWRERIDVSIAKSRKIRGGNYVQIATVDPVKMEPRNRTVVFRGFAPLALPGGAGAPPCAGESCVMRMITDNRSGKVAEAGAAPAGKQNAEMVWWFAKSSEQYRVRGRLVFVGGGAHPYDGDEALARARREQWGNLSDMAREQFFWRPPGEPYEPQHVPPAGGRGEDGRVLPPPDAFLLMLLFPTAVDYLRLTDNFRQRDCVVDGAWQHARVNA